MFNLFKHELFSRWVAILAWGAGLAAFASLYIAVFPEMASEMAGLAQMSIYRMLGMDLTSFAGYIASVVVQIVPQILAVYVIMISTGTLAGEEENGTLELIVAMPLQRWQIVSMKTAALAFVLLLILVFMSIGSGITLNIVSQTSEVDATPLQLFVALMGAYPLMLAFFAIGLFFGAFLPSRRLAVAAMTILYIGSLLMKSIAGFVTSMEAMKYFSLFSYMETSVKVFEEGLALNNVLILMGIAALFFVLALWSFQGRNLTVGQWLWERQQTPTN